ncbi:hypothetical protein AALP_AAs71746U000100 [Arabis alpina]|uniref:DUF1204 domain-containing protein n=1 Tax=Arabis alpina TaxID=50452 RepID=A0A087FZ39_ARAAL|nr:hypothetical protein AALP_AAs71746U000100 [Arabis alpina]
MRKASTADHTPQSVVWADPPVELIAISSHDDDSSDEGSTDHPARANPFDREDEAGSGEGSDHPDSEPEEEEEDGEGEDEHKVEYEHLHSPIRVDPENPLGPGLGQSELVPIDNIPTLSTADTIRDMIRGRNLLIAEEDILVPTTYDRPWTPPDGFLSYARGNSEYHYRPNLTAEIGRSVNCLDFEEMVQFKRKGPYWTCTRPPPESIDNLLLVLKKRGEQNWLELLEQRAQRCSQRVNTCNFSFGSSNVSAREIANSGGLSRLNLPLALLCPYTFRIPKDRKPRSKKAKTQVEKMVKPERKVVKYTGEQVQRTHGPGSASKYDKKAGKRAIETSSLKPSSAITPAKRQRGGTFGKGVGKGHVNMRSKLIELASSGYLRQYDPTLDFVDKPVYTLYAEELIRAVSHVNFMATRLEKTELRIIKLTSEVEALKGKLDRQVEISKEMTEEADSARGREKVAGNKLGMLRDQLERERNEKDAQILLLKGENEKLKAVGMDVVQRTIQTMIGKALSEMRIRYEGRLDYLYQCSVDAEEVNRLNFLINQVNYSLELYAGLRVDRIAVPEEKIEKLLADLKGMNEEFDGLVVEVAKPEDYLVTLVANQTLLDLSYFQLDFGEGSRTRSNREDVPAGEDVEVPPDGEGAQGEGRQSGEVDAVDASTNEELDRLFHSSKND